jgi:hypothetical protein
LRVAVAEEVLRQTHLLVLVLEQAVIGLRLEHQAGVHLLRIR